MLGILILVATVFILVLVFYNPKLGPIFLWPILFMYPHFYMLQRQFLPLNIGIDDLFICVFFLAVLLRRNLMGGVRPRLGFAFWCALLFFFVLLMANINSYMAVGARGPEFVKAALKGVITVLLVYSLLNTIDNLDDLKQSVFAFCFFAGLGALIVIAQNYYPRTMYIFACGDYVRMLHEGYQDIRPAGAFFSANDAALVIGAACLIIVSTLRLKSMYFRKNLRFLLLAIMVVAILMTRSRAGFLGLATSLLLMCFFGKQKRYAVVFAIIGLIALISMPQVREPLLARFGTAETMGRGLMWSLKQRYESAHELWRNITLARFLFGRTHYADRLLGLQYPHSFYQGLTLSFGVGGTIWIIWLIIVIVRKAKMMKNYPDLRVAAFGSAIRWCLVSFAVFGVGAGIFDNIYGSYTLFLLTVVAQRGGELIYQHQQLYENEMYTYDSEWETAEEELAAANYSGIDRNFSGC